MLANMPNSKSNQLCPVVVGITAVQAFTDIMNPDEQKLKSMKNKFAVSLLNKQSPVDIDLLKVESNKTYIKQIMNNVINIPTITIPPLQIDDTIAEFDLIEPLPDDSKELVRDISRFNMKIASWTHDHSKIHSTQHTYNHDLIELMKSEHYKAVKKYITDMADACLTIEGWDNSGKDFIYHHDEIDDDEYDDTDDFDDGSYNETRISSGLAEKTYESAVSFIGEISLFQSKYQQNECPICARCKKEYEIMLKSVQMKRQFIKDEYERAIKAIQNSVDETMDDFMNQYFPNKDNLKLMDIVKMWKLVKKEMIKQDEIAGMLEETEHWKITNVHNIKRAKKI